MDNSQNNLSCCQNNNNKKGFWSGICYGLIPHFPCLAFIIFSVLGVTFAASIFRPLMMSRYFFYLLIGLSLLLASLAALFYLKKNKILNWIGIKKSRKYLLTLFLTTIIVNLLFFFIIFPALANLSANRVNNLPVTDQNFVTLQVDLPCPGHAYLVTEELNKLPGIRSVRFNLPNLFDISFDPKIISKDKILGLDVLKIYQGQIIEENISPEAACPLSPIQ